MILPAHKDCKRTVTISKHIFNFDDFYIAFLQIQLKDLTIKIQNKFREEEFGAETFSKIDLKIKRIS